MLTAAAVLYVCLLAAFSLMPVSSDSALGATSTRRAVNNLLHLPAYAILAVLIYAVARAWNLLALPGAVLTGAVGAFGFGALMEIAQIYIPGRGATMLDFGLNGTGAFAIMILTLWRQRAKPEESVDESAGDTTDSGKAHDGG